MDSVLEAKALVERRRFDLIVVDGIASETKELLFQAKAQNPHIKSLLVSEDTGVEEVLKSLDHEIIGCVFKPLRESEVRFEVNRILSSNLTSREMTHRAEKFVFNQSRNPQMAALYQSAVDKIAKSDSTVLIQGESGTGKELMATWIYSHSLRKNRPFVKVSCAVLPEGILESELFGHERGSFTGAYTKRKGRFEVADGGTIFLDEIGEISPSIQSKFL
jgi:DNA-binding NtrC family response regulator